MKTPKVEDVGPAVVSYYRDGYSKTQRFGQFFVNNYVPEQFLPWPELFYQTDDEKALRTILDFVEKGEK